MKKAIILLNGKSGNNQGKRNAFSIIEQINAEGYMTLVVPVGKEQITDINEVLKDQKDAFDLCVSVGGDGTLHHTINAMLKNDCNQPIVYIPCGTTNDYAHSLGLTSELPQNKELLTDEAVKLDVGLFNKEYFSYVAAFGALTDVSYNTPQEAKNALGYTAYALNTLQAMPSGLGSRIKVSVASKEFSGDGIYMYGSVSNCYSVAGIRSPILEDVSMNDGLFEVILIKAPKNIAELIEIAGTLVSGDIHNKANKHVQMFRTKKVTFTFEENTEWTLDGEYGGETKKAVITVKKERITLLK